MVTSEALFFEAARNPNQSRREYVLEVLRKTDHIIEVNEEMAERAREFIEVGIKPLDGLHLASAEKGEVKYFCTCDDKFLKTAKSVSDVKVLVM